MVTKQFHEIRDPIHVFVRLDSDERKVLDSRPVQRLRHIHQLAMSYLVYPGATHKRFEHSLGVMELAGRVFDVITADQNIHESVRPVFSDISGDGAKSYWRKVLRMAALCHDIGHLPFSHAAEHELLPEGWNHERITSELVVSDEMRVIWDSMRPFIVPEDVAKIAVGPEKMSDTNFTPWEILLSEIITGDSLGVDRMDYLLRDSHHTGVAYGRFDHYRLIDTMRVLPTSQNSDSPTLGIEGGGVHSAEALLLARYYMFMQVYHHRIRIAYDFHLKEFLSAWLENGSFSTDIKGHQSTSDNEVLSAISHAAGCPAANGYEHADRIVNRKHFRPVYIRTRSDEKNFVDPLSSAYESCIKRYGSHNVHKSEYTQRKSYRFSLKSA